MSLTGRLEQKLIDYVSAFNADDEEIYTEDICNARAAEYLLSRVPLFECPDKTIETVYYYRFWTLRKHLKTTPYGHILTEFSPDVRWAGAFNSINAAAGHHLREVRWMRGAEEPMKEYISFWLDRRGNALAYSSWLASAV